MNRIPALLVFFLMACHIGFSQLPLIDKSPMDMSYYPANYPMLKIQDKLTEPLVARVIYSRPQKNDRVIFGDLIEYGKVWRLGANEATEIEFFQQVKINNISLKKGRYTLYSIPYPDKWTIIINKDADTWGSFKYDIKKDIARIDIPVQKQPEKVEIFSLYFEKAPGGFAFIAAWDDVKVYLPISLQ
ncbi:MAG TPA: DUF2911 domain-containing protein [Ferruginibacter sp.]|nr:DUF2911 domain-containing protein [Ferruginibacter sp.]